MKIKIFSTAAAFAIMATSAIAQSNSTATTAPLMGVWRCEMHGLPAVTLTVTNEGGSLNGAVLFYLHRTERGKAETATPGVPEPLFNPKIDGQTLTFEVSHRRAHPPSSLQDAPVTFEIKLVSPDKAQLINESQHDPKAPEYFLTKSEY
jgi:hypothetical protein